MSYKNIFVVLSKALQKDIGITPEEWIGKGETTWKVLRFFRIYPFDIRYNSFASNNFLLLRPYIVRFIIFNLLFVPSTKPLLHSLITACSIASISFSNPDTKEANFFIGDVLDFSIKR